MPKINYPSDGIYRHCRNLIELISNDLLKAKSTGLYNIPYEFVYRNYLMNLTSNLNKFHTEMNKIESKIQRVNKNYEQLTSDLVISTKKLETSRIKERDRMIY